MYMLQAGGVVLLVGDNTGLEFREVASKGAAQPFIIVYVRFVWPAFFLFLSRDLLEIKGQTRQVY